VLDDKRDRESDRSSVDPASVVPAVAPFGRGRPSPAAATTVGSMPGTSIREAVSIVVDELAGDDGVPHLPELPERGPGGDLIGRTGGMLSRITPDLALETTPDGWRFADAPGREARRAWSWVGEDLDAWEEGLTSFTGVAAASIAGPWTLAASIELHYGERALRDKGAARDIAGALAQVATELVADLRRRIPLATHMIWIDEPSINAVLEGSIATQSGRWRIAAVDAAVVETALTLVVDAIHAAGAAAAIHCCAARPPHALLLRTGIDALSIDLTRHSSKDDDRIGELVDSGTRLVAGIIPGVDSELSGDIATVEPVRVLGQRLGFDSATLADAVMLSPTCGLAGASMDYVRAALPRLRSAARTMRDQEPGDDER